MKNKAVYLTKVGQVEIIEDEINPLCDRQALIKVMSSGICGSDLHYFTHGGLGSFLEKLPMPLGHEPSGIVEEVKNIPWLKPGDRVAIEPASHCGNCEMCHTGRLNLCLNGTFLGARGFPGAMREYITVNENQIVKLSDNITFDEGALLEPLGVAFHAINRSMLKYGETVAILGAGPIGLSLLNIVKAMGSQQIIVIDPLEYRLAKASKLGADIVIQSNNSVTEHIKDLLTGRLCDVVFDAAGKPQSLMDAISLVAPAGRVILVGIPTYDLMEINPHKLRIKEVDLISVRRSNNTLHLCIKHQEHAPWRDNIVSHKYALYDCQKAFETAANYENLVHKSMFKPNV